VFLLLGRNEAERCQAAVASLPAGDKATSVVHEDREQIWLVLSGAGSATAGDETESVKKGDVVFVPRDTLHSAQAGREGLTCFCLAALVTKGQ